MEIKFRGKRMSDGKLIYGYYHVRGGDAYIDDWRVEPDSVAQFLDYDASGDEVYEGDKLTDLFAEDGEVLTARRDAFAYSEDNHWFTIGECLLKK